MGMLIPWQEGASRRQRVWGAALVRARPFYGYTAGDCLFVKIMMLAPPDVQKAAALLQVRLTVAIPSSSPAVATAANMWLSLHCQSCVLFICFSAIFCV